MRSCRTMYFLGYFCIGLLLSSPLWAVSMNFNGHFRATSALHNKLNLGKENLGDDNKMFVAGRALLEPTLVIDDHFSLKSQWSLLTSPNFTPQTNVSLGNGQGAWVFGDTNTVGLFISRVWLEWTSDFGVLRIGRMPVSWGYGLLWDSGNGIWDDFQTTYDRLEYRLHLGNVVGGLAYSKPRKGSVLGNSDDSEFYTVFLKYDSPESQLEAGVLYEKQVRSSSQKETFLNQTPGFDNAANIGIAPGRRTPYPQGANVVDIYLKKTIRYFTFGGEFGWLSGDAFDFGGTGGEKDDLSAYGALLMASYEYHKFNVFMEFLFASGDSNLNSDKLNGFVLLHRNRRPGIILGRELLGNLYGNNVNQGSLVAYSRDEDSYSGVIYLRPGIRIDWSEDWSTGLEAILAYKAQAKAGEAKHLGLEFDLGAEYRIYKNCELGAIAGFLIPGDGLNVNDPEGAFAVRATLAVKF